MRTSITPSTTPIFGGDDRTRTDDPLLAKQVLYQLSYAPAETATTIIPRRGSINVIGWNRS